MKQGSLALLAACCILTLLLASAALGQQTPTDPKQDKPKGLNELVLANLAGILSGVAAIIAAVAAVLSRKNNQEAQKNNRETQEKTRSELSSFKRELQSELVDDGIIRIIAKQGGFLSDRDLPQLSGSLRTVLFQQGGLLEEMQRQGAFLTKEALVQWLVQWIEEGRLRIELLKIEHRLAESERKVVDHDERIFKLERPGGQLESKVDELRSVLEAMHLKGK